MSKFNFQVPPSLFLNRSFSLLGSKSASTMSRSRSKRSVLTSTRSSLTSRASPPARRSTTNLVVIFLNNSKKLRTRGILLLRLAPSWLRPEKPSVKRPSRANWRWSRWSAMVGFCLQERNLDFGRLHAHSSDFRLEKIILISTSNLKMVSLKISHPLFTLSHSSL